MLTSIKTDIELDNNSYLKLLDGTQIMPTNAIDVQDLKMKNIVKEKAFLFIIDFKILKEEQYKKVLKKLLYIKKKLTKKKIDLDVKENSRVLLGYLINYDSQNKAHNDFILGINAISYNTKYERYNYIYDTVCDYLDSFFYGKNLCDFKNNKCGEKRNTDSLIGCCHHYKNKLLGPLISNNLVPCEYLKKDHSCGAKCISCKLFTCDYLEKKGTKFRIKDILLLDVFFNPIQKYYIKYMVFTPKEKILKKLMKT